jgi:hypothetical protein
VVEPWALDFPVVTRMVFVLAMHTALYFTLYCYRSVLSFYLITIALGIDVLHHVFLQTPMSLQPLNSCGHMDQRSIQTLQFSCGDAEVIMKLTTASFQSAQLSLYAAEELGKCDCTCGL